MGATRTSTLSTNVEVSSGDPETGTVDAYSSQIDVYLGTMEGEGSLAAEVYGSASAYGTDTFAELDIDAQLSANGLQVDLSAQSAAQSSDGIPYASSVGGIYVYGHADAYVGITRQSTWTEIGPEGATVVSSYEGSVSAVNPGGATGADMPVGMADPETPAEVAPYLDPPPDSCGCGTPEPSGYNLDGNLAIYEVNAIAFGENSYVDLMLDAIAVEDAFSDVTAVVFLAI